jgi:hypothetical protein
VPGHLPAAAIGLPLTTVAKARTGGTGAARHPAVLVFPRRDVEAESAA